MEYWQSILLAALVGIALGITSFAVVQDRFTRKRNAEALRKAENSIYDGTTGLTSVEKIYAAYDVLLKHAYRDQLFDGDLSVTVVFDNLGNRRRNAAKELLSQLNDCDTQGKDPYEVHSKLDACLRDARWLYSDLGVSTEQLEDWIIVNYAVKLTEIADKFSTPDNNPNESTLAAENLIKNLQRYNGSMAVLLRYHEDFDKMPYAQALSALALNLPTVVRYKPKGVQAESSTGDKGAAPQANAANASATPSFM